MKGVVNYSSIVVKGDCDLHLFWTLRSPMFAKGLGAVKLSWCCEM